MSFKTSMSLKNRIALYFFIVLVPIILTSLFVSEIGRRILINSASFFDTSVQLDRLSTQLNKLTSAIDTLYYSDDLENIENYYLNYKSVDQQMETLNSKILVNPVLLTEKNLVYTWRQFDQNMEEFRDQQFNLHETENILQAMVQIIKLAKTSQEKGNIEGYLSFLDWYSTFQSGAFLLVLDVIAICLILISYFSQTISIPIISLADASSELAKGNFSIPDLVPEGSREVEILAASYNTMKRSLFDYIKNIEEKQDVERQLMEKNIQNLKMGNLLRSTELRALQAQINPHFMFNTLNIGVQLAVVEQADKTADYLANLAEVYRYNLKKLNQKASLKEELENLEYFINIMTIRFGSRIQYSLEICEARKSLYVPSMTFQPLVENSILHGLESREQGGLIMIQGKELEGFYQICVSDNGDGIPAPILTEILSLLDKDNIEPEIQDKYGIGLLNVLNRFHLFYDRKDLISIESKEDQGTRIYLNIPLLEGK